MTTEGYSLEEVEQMHGINVANACRMLPIISSGISKEQRELFYCYDILKKELNRNHVSYFKAVLYSYKVTRGAWEICYWIRLNENSYMLQMSDSFLFHVKGKNMKRRIFIFILAIRLC